MSVWRVTGVGVEPASDGRPGHISKVRAEFRGAPLILSRWVVVNDIRSGLDSYYTDVNGSEAELVVMKCPSCEFGDYLRTVADTTTADNRLSLPRV